MKIETDICDNTFWVIITSIIGLLFVVFIGLLLSYSHNKNKLIVSAINKSNSPVEVAVALGKEYNSSDVAMLLSNKQGDE